jgi:chromosome segregation ATPase
MTQNNIEIGVKLVADPASAEEVKKDITKKVASLQAAANQVKGKKGEGIRINLSSLMKEANAIDVSEASKDPIAFTQTLSDFYEKIAKNAKTTYLSLEKKQKTVAKKLTDLQNQSEAANKKLLDSQNAYENVKNKGLKKDDSGKKIHDSDFRIGAYDKEKGTEGFFGVSRAYASASVVQDIASTHNLSGINTRADLFKLAKEQPENKNVQDAVEEVNKAEKDFKKKINLAADAQQDAAKSANEYEEALKEATAKISTKNKKDSKTLDILKESTDKSIDFKKVSQKAKSEKKQQKSDIDAKIASDQNKLEELQNTGEKNDNVVTKAIKSFFGYQQVIRALRTVVNFTVKTISDLDKALTDQAIVSGLTRKQV